MILHVAGAFRLVRRRRAAFEFVEQRSVRLAHHLGEHVEAAAMRHADADFAHAEIAAALDDLLERRDQRFAAVESETLGAGIFDVDEFLEAFRFHQFVEDGALALHGEADFLVAAFDAPLDPAFLRGVGDVHELDAERLAISAAQDGDDLAHGREFEAEHLVEENPAVEIGLLKAIRARIEFFLVLLGRELERIERGLLHVAGRDIDAGRLRLLLDLVGDAPFGVRPLPVERGHQVAVRTQRPIRFLPGGAARAVDDVGALVLQALEELPPFGVDRGRVVLVFGVEVFDVSGVAAVEERGAGEGGIGVLAGHGCSILARHNGRVAKGDSPRDRHPTADCCFNAIYDACKSTKDLRLNQDFNTSTRVFPIRAGEGDTLIPADSIAAILDGASPLPPEMIAPAWPMRRPGGAVRPAMKPTVGFLRPRLASSLRNWAASSSAEPPISPIMTIDSVFGSAKNISSTAMNSVPLTGSPPMPTAVVWPRPSRVVWNTAS